MWLKSIFRSAAFAAADPSPHGRRRRCCTAVWFGVLFLALGFWALLEPNLAPAAAQQVADQSQPPPKVMPAEVLAASFPITDGVNAQVGPAIAYNGQADEFFAVWEHEHSATDPDIYGRRLTAAGTVVGGSFPVATSGAAERHPAVAANLVDNQYLVVYEYGASESNHDIYAQRFSAAGAPLGGGIQVSTYANNEFDPVVVYNPTDNEYVVLWETYGIDDNSILGRRVSSAGGLAGSIFTVGYSGEPRPPSGAKPAAAFNSVRNEYLVVWQRYRSLYPDPGGEYDIYGQRLTNAGVQLGSAFPISTWEYDQRAPRAAYSPAWNEYLCVWEDHHWGWGEDWDIYGQRIDYDGALVGESFGVSWDSSNHRLNPDVTYGAATNMYFVVWEYEYSTTDHDVYGRQVTPAGTLFGGESVISNLGANEKVPGAAAGKAERVLVAWEDSRNAVTTGTDIYGAVAEFAAFSGHVYQGQFGDKSTPLPAVGVDLYCSNDAGYAGTLLTHTTTDSAGAYKLPYYHVCEFYQILETDPPGYISVNAVTISGTVQASSWIRYAYPVGPTTVLFGNDFWDTPKPPDDTTAPENWANFVPAGWITVQTVTSTVRVEDTFSGLAVGSGAYAFSKDGGATWSAWLPASCTGANGTTAPQIIIAVVAFGQDANPNGANRIKFRIADVAGNVGYSPVYSVAIDTVPSQNPTTLFSATHTPNVWSDLNLVTCQWNAGSDDRSGLAGYSISWNHSPGDMPDAFADTIKVVATSYALPDGDAWYCHVRAVDNAGNGAQTAIHHGPFQIDTAPPSSAVKSLEPWQGSLSFLVSWFGDPGTGAPIAGYDIKVIDTFGGSANTINWLSNTQGTSATFTGTRGHTYSFFSRARDAAGHQEAFAASPDTVTTVGRDLQVIVRDEGGVARAGAKVFHSGSLVGLTGSNGAITVKSLMIGDTLAALLKVYEQPSLKPAHAADSSGNWAWRIYQTSIGLASNGATQLFTVAGIDGSQYLTVRKNQTLIGVHMVVSVEWDASSTYLADLQKGLKGASGYLYDVVDGQMFWELIEVFDDGKNWAECDLRIHASNDVWPNASGSIFGITGGTDKHIYMGRYFDGTTSNTGNWELDNGFRTMIHEFGHYGLGLWDEYLDRTGKKTSNAYCATNYSTQPQAGRSSIMYYQFTSTELCSNEDPNHRHRTDTQHDAIRGETTWATVVSRFSDTASPRRWTILTPEDRNAIMDGPTDLPIAGLMKVQVTDANTSACAPFGIHGSCTGCTRPITETVVWVDRSCTNCADLQQGKLDAAGNISIFGAHNGDVVRAQHPDGASGALNVTCAGAEGSEGEAAEVEGATLPIKLDPFRLTAEVVPLGGNRVRVGVAATTKLADAPAAHLWQAGAAEPIAVALTFDAEADRYQGEATLNGTLGLRGNLTVAATDKSGHTVRLNQSFNLAPTTADEINAMLQSEDGNFMMTLPPGALDGDAVVGIQSSAKAPAPPKGWVQVSDAYDVLVSTGQIQLRKPAAINLRYRAEQIKTVDLATLQIQRWDTSTSKWLPLGGNIDPDQQLVSTDANALTTFAVFGRVAQPGSETRLFLPVIVRGATLAAGDLSAPTDIPTAPKEPVTGRSAFELYLPTVKKAP